MQDTQQKPLSIRTLYTSVWVAVFATAWFFGFGHASWGYGFVIGAFLSLMSKSTLTFLVPFLFYKGATHRSKALLSLTLFMKLPLYMAGLYIGTRTPGVEPIALALGIALAPMVLTAKAIAEAILEAGYEARKEKAKGNGEPVYVKYVQWQTRPARPTQAKPAPERG